MAVTRMRRPGWTWARTCPNSMLDLPDTPPGGAVPGCVSAALPVDLGPSVAGTASLFDLPATISRDAAGSGRPEPAPAPRPPTGLCPERAAPNVSP